MSYNEYFKCIKCGEINTISHLNKVEEQEETWSLISTPSTRSKFKQFAARMTMKGGDALAYLLTLDETKETIMKEDNRFGIPNTVTQK